MDGPGSGSLCPICGSDSSRLLLQKVQDTENKKPLRLRSCLACSTVYLESWDNWYSQQLYEYYRERIGSRREDLYDPITEKRYNELLSWFGRLANGRRILDIGCGQGHFVDAALRGGFQVQGIETSPPAVEICRRFGLPVNQIDVFSDELKPSTFDICTLFEVIEHVPQPASLLRRAEQLLVAGGYLYLTTPNFDSLERRLMQNHWSLIYPEHLTYFTPRSMRAVIKRYTSFKVLTIETRNIGIGDIRRHLRRNIRSAIGVGRDTQLHDCIRVDDSHLREAIESSQFLRLAKAGVNQILSAFGMGSSMRVLCRK